MVKLAILAAVICIVFALVGKGCDMITGGGHHGDEAAPAGGVAASADYGSEVSPGEREAAEYLRLIKSGEMTFAQVEEISRWVDDNSDRDDEIKDYAVIKGAISEYAKCRDLLLEINSDADFAELATEIKRLVPRIRSDGAYADLLVKLRVKMQRFVIRGGRLLDKEGMERNLYEFAESHPDGIESFAELKYKNS